jgi:hypothetical protein
VLKCLPKIEELAMDNTGIDLAKSSIPEWCAGVVLLILVKSGGLWGE